MGIVLQSSQVLAVGNGVKCLVYAPAGTGKTVLLATAPNPVVISAESGLLSLSKKNLIKMFGEDDPTITYDLPIIEVKTYADLLAARAWCDTAEAHQFSTICIDSITEIAEVVLNNAKKESKDPRQAYGVLIEKMTDTLKSFRDLAGFNIYMSSKQAYIKDAVDGTSKYGPMMPGNNLPQAIPYLFDEVFNLGIGKTEEGETYRYLRTQPDMQYEAKDRSGTLDEIERPNLTHIFNKIQGE